MRSHFLFAPSVSGALPRSSGGSSAASYIYVVVGTDARVKRVRLTHGWLVLKPHKWWWPCIWLRLPRPVREFIASAGEEGPGRPARAPSDDD